MQCDVLDAQGSTSPLAFIEVQNLGARPKLHHSRREPGRFTLVSVGSVHYGQAKVSVSLRDLFYIVCPVKLRQLAIPSCISEVHCAKIPAVQKHGVFIVANTVTFQE